VILVPCLSSMLLSLLSPVVPPRVAFGSFGSCNSVPSRSAWPVRALPHSIALLRCVLPALHSLLESDFRSNAERPFAWPLLRMIASVQSHLDFQFCCEYLFQAFGFSTSRSAAKLHKSVPVVTPLVTFICISHLFAGIRAWCRRTVRSFIPRIGIKIRYFRTEVM